MSKTTALTERHGMYVSSPLPLKLVYVCMMSNCIKKFIILAVQIIITFVIFFIMLSVTSWLAGEGVKRLLPLRAAWRPGFYSVALTETDDDAYYTCMHAYKHTYIHTQAYIHTYSQSSPCIHLFSLCWPDLVSIVSAVGPARLGSLQTLTGFLLSIPPLH